MAWRRLVTEDDFGGFDAPTAVIGGAAVPGVATTAMRSDAAPELGPLTRDLDFGGFRATNVADPAGAQDAATKAYVDALAQGLAPKESVRAATTGDITLSGARAIDGVAVVTGDRVLVKNQAAGAQNGIYVAAAGAWARAADADSEGDLRGASVFVEEGTTQADSLWVMTTNAPITVGTTVLTWAQFSSAGDIVAGAGLSKAGNTLDVNIDGATLEINADALRVKTLGITDAHVAAANKDGAVGTPSMRTLGTGSQQGCAGNDGRLSNTRIPAAAAGGTAWDLADNEIVGLRPKGYTTGARPGSAAVGRIIYDTDISRPMVWV